LRGDYAVKSMVVQKFVGGVFAHKPSIAAVAVVIPRGGAASYVV